MLSLHDREWKEFFIGSLFDVKRPVARSEKQYEVGKVPFVASGNVNNGAIRCCEPQFNEHLDSGNCITVSPVDGSAFYQEYDFLGRGGDGSSILLLYNPCVNKYSGLFIAKMISQTCSKYHYGNMGSQERIRREKAMLPIDEQGNPDYAFMESYIREREQQIVQRYIDYIGNNIQIGGGIPPLHEKTWRNFFIDEIVEINSGRDIYEDERMPGDIPYISSSSVNNGICHFVSNTNETLEGGCISVNRNGSVGYAFYHSYKALYSNDTRKLRLKHQNKYISIFVANQITNQRAKYSYGYKMGTGRLKRQKIMLPIDESGNPDWNYMEQYTKALFKRIKLQYLQSKITA